MRDFTQIAPFVGGSLRHLEELLRTHGFRLSEELSPSHTGGYSSEIWLRREGQQYFAVRIDWLGHGHARQPHYHFEAFPAERRFDYEHAVAIDSARRKGIGVQRFDPFTGSSTQFDPHAPLVRDDK